MRILKFFLLAVFWIGLVLTVVFFLGRELLLVWGAQVLQKDYESLLQKNYANYCIKQFAYDQDYWTQLRFIDNRNYQLELVCEDFVGTPIVLDTRVLPPLLFKTSLGSGFILDEQELPAFVELSVLGRRIFVYTDAQKMHIDYLDKPDLDYIQGPTSACAAHNYQCCSLEVQSGLGEQLNDVIDCPKSCYETCLLRPQVLSFNSRPALDESTRTVVLYFGEELTLSYVLGNGKGDVFADQLDATSNPSWLKKIQAFLTKTPKEVSSEAANVALPITVMIDFGDGETWQGQSLQETLSHRYTCQSKTCFFQIKITAQDARGVLSVDNESAKMIVKVN